MIKLLFLIILTASLILPIYTSHILHASIYTSTPHILHSQTASNNIISLISKALKIDERGNHTGSALLLLQALSLHPSSWQRTCALNNLALSLVYSKTPELALKYIDEALVIDGTNPLSLYNKGYLLLRLNQISASIPFFEHVLAQNPHDKNATLNLEFGLEKTQPSKTEETK